MFRRHAGEEQVARGPERLVGRSAAGAAVGGATAMPWASAVGSMCRCRRAWWRCAG